MDRHHSLDNAKFSVMLLVVLGHLIEPLLHMNPWINIVYTSLYSFHMPVFVMISGMLSRTHLDRASLRRLFDSLVVPLLVFTVLYEAFHFALEGRLSGYGVNLQPYWILWFLWSLLIWRLVLPLFLKLKFPLLISFVLAVGTGYFESIGYFLGISRTLYFFPFFLLGHFCLPRLLASQALMRIPRIVWLSILVGNLGLAFHFRGFPFQWFYGSWSYARLGHPDWSGAAIRLLLLLISLVTVFAAILVMPRSKGWMSRRGVNSLHIYLWHGFIVKGLVALGLVNYLTGITVDKVLAMLLVLAIVLTLLLSSKLVADLTRRFLLAPVASLFHRGG